MINIALLVYNFWLLKCLGLAHILFTNLPYTYLWKKLVDILLNVNVYYAGFNDPKSLLDEHGLNQVKETDQENLR